MIKKLFAPGNDSVVTSFALLVLRLWLGLTMLLEHGLTKINNFSDYAQHFPDPLHVGRSLSLGWSLLPKRPERSYWRWDY